MRFLIALVVVFASFGAFAADPGDLPHLQKCMEAWGKHPFNAKNPEYRTIMTKVKVLGIGGDLVDDKASGSPELVFIKPSVDVMSKNVMKLLNPNGWYCLKGKVSVMSSSTVELACNSKFATSQEGTAVMGSNKEDTGGVTVMGKTTIKRIGCAK